MYLLLQTLRQHIRYSAFTPEGELVYEGACPIDDWSNKVMDRVFKAHVLGKLRGHGAIFTHIGLVIPFADPSYVSPQPASEALLKQWAGTSLRKKVLWPSFLLLRVIKSAWPHLPCLFLFDSCLSSQLPRETTLLPYSYETNKQLAVTPLLLQSYGHKANLLKRVLSPSVISVYLDESASCALFEKGMLKDALVTYSAVSAMRGLSGLGAIDPGLTLELAEKHKPPELQFLLIDKPSLQAMTETNHDIDTLLQLAGLVPRSNHINLDAYPIESIEWIELSVRSFVRAIKQAIGSLAAGSKEPPTIVINTSIISDKSALWRLVMSHGLSQYKVSFSPHSLMQAACYDLISSTQPSPPSI